MSSQPVDRLHPVAEFAQVAGVRLDALADAPLWSMPDDQLLETSKALAKDRAQLEAIDLGVLAEIERRGAATESGAGSAADWVAITTRKVRREARSDLRLAQAVEQHDVLSAAMRAGMVNTAQARAIVTALDRLPTSGEFAVTLEQRTQAEIYLVGQAATHDAKTLRILGSRIFEVIAPEVAEKFDGQALEREEAEALRRTTLTMFEDNEGTCHGRFRIPAAHGQMLKKMILAIASPARSTGSEPTPVDDMRSGIDPDLPTPIRHGIAFTQLIESISAAELPRTGGCGATVVVTMNLDQLTAALDEAGVCTLDTGGRITAAEARRMACTAGIIPVVLGGNSQVLDVGRRRRLHTESMRLAMGVRDRGCTAQDCETPPGLCHAHHDQPWSEGGGTSVETGRLLCPHHHRRIHDPKYETRHLPGGKVSFHRRT